MPQAQIAFSNLKAEMARNNIAVKDIAAAIDTSIGTAGAKLSRKTPLKLNEAFIIKERFFPSKELPYLFAELTQDTSAVQRPAPEQRAG